VFVFPLFPSLPSHSFETLPAYRGYGTVARLAEHGAHVYMCARSPTKASDAIAGIKKLYPKANITLLEMDHNNLSSVVSAANIFLSKETALHGLVNKPESWPLPSKCQRMDTRLNGKPIIWHTGSSHLTSCLSCSELRNRSRRVASASSMSLHRDISGLRREG
jgi:NAD(P)-dependent dehydrogenase (short-subunit alcohol dehydrogenase family)